MITQDDLLLYLYEETNAEQTKFITEALDADAGLKERLAVLKAGKDRLEKIKLLSPDPRTLENIFAHADSESKAYT